MAFDSTTRNKLARMVAACRGLLTDEFDAQLQSPYGIYAVEGRVEDLDKLAHLDDDQYRVASLLRDRISHLESGLTTEKNPKQAAIKRLLREQAFTVLNRFAALRMAEEREIVQECVAQGLKSRGFQVFETVAHSGLGGAYDRYRVFVGCLFDELALDLGVLFDRFSPFGLLFPRESALLQLFDQLNQPDLKELWKADETIGWIYQYFNDEAERKKMREDSAAPRNSRELAVRNQFFTPRYVVEFLTDNTLGRIWYEMTKGQTRLKDQCRYMVRRPVEVFLTDNNNSDWANAHPGIVAAIQGDFSNLPETARWWEDLQRLALAIDGYGLSPKLGLGDCLDFYQRKSEDYERTGSWHGSAIELWLCLFAVQRSWHNQDANPEGRALQAIVALYRALRAALQAARIETQSQEELLKQPVYIPHRPLKDPRTIRMLDPACGSMHFGLYSFDLFEVIYEEAWAIEETAGASALIRPKGMKSLHETYATKDAFLRDVPRLIIEHNLHGIDIDPRCAQIAGLSLWLRAQKSWQQMKLKPTERPRITKSNIVCAEPMPGEKELLKEFTSQLEHPAIGQLVEHVFEKMKLAGEAGSLLKIEEEIRSAIAEAREQWQLGGKLEQAKLFGELEPAKQEELRIDVSGITDEQFWDKAEERIYEALRDYAEQAENGGGFQRRLFAEDAARGFAFIDVCRKRYDVALMNPPFGESSARVNAYLKREFALGRPDAYMCFIFRASRILAARGRCGAITSRTFLTLQFFESLRELLLEGILRLESLLDLGGGVLDGATVETSAYVSEVIQTDKSILFLNFPRHSAVDELTETILALQRGVLSEDSYIKFSKAIANMPGKVFAYRMVASVLHAFASGRPLDAEFCMQRTANADDKDSDFSVRQGLIPGDQFRFSRLWQEVPASAFGWCWAAKGGDYSRYISREDLLLAWKDDGAEIKAFAEEHYGGASRTIKNEHLFFKPGISFPRVSSVGLNARVLPSNFAFTDTGMAVIPKRKKDCLPLLGFLNSRLADYCCNSLHPGRKFEIAHLSSLPVTPDVLNSAEMARIVSESVDIVRKLFSSHEDKVEFLLPEKLQQRVDQSDDDSATSCPKSAAALTRLAELQATLNKLVFAIYNIPQAEQVEILRDLQDGTSASEFAEHLSGLTKVFLLPEAVSASDCDHVDLVSAEHGTTSFMLGCALGRWDIRYATGAKAVPALPDPFAPLPVFPPGMLQNAQGLPAAPEDVPADYPLRISWPGILVDDESRPEEDIEHRMREASEVIWKDKAEAIEHEACEILGVKSLREYFRKPTGFFADHLSRYSKSRRQAPIYWPLSTASGKYTLWIYYHRLTDQTLFQCVNDFVKPKLEEVTRDIERLQRKVTGGGAAKEREQLEELTDFQIELKEFHDELLRVANLPYKPNLNDGVLITASPLWQLFRLPKWRKDLKACWESLAAGEYDWAHLAYTIWPDRVKEVCKKDRSIAIAHGLEELCEIKAPEKKAKKGKKKKADEAELELEEGGGK